MANISGISGIGTDWSSLAAARSKRQERLFEQIDTNGSGTVDSTELQSLIDKIAKKTGVDSGISADKLLSQLDTDGDGSLNSDEFASGLQSILPPPSTFAFAQARGTSDGNDQIGQAGFAAGAAGPQQAHSGPPPGGAVSDNDSDSTSYDPLDTNKDGVVSAAERAAADIVQALFSPTDTNVDQTVDDSNGIDFAQTLTDAIAETTAAAESADGSTNRQDSGAPRDGTGFTHLLTDLMQRAYEDVAATTNAGLWSSELGASLSALA